MMIKAEKGDEAIYWRERSIYICTSKLYDVPLLFRNCARLADKWHNNYISTPVIKRFFAILIRYTFNST